MVIMGILSPKVLMLGLTDGNIERMKKGFPIKITAVTHPAAKDILGGIEVVIFYGQTEELIRESVEKANLIGEKTKVVEKITKSNN